MKLVMVTAAFLFSVSAFANPFDVFSGKYVAVEKPSISNNHAAECNRYSFSEITGFEVQAGKLVFTNNYGFSTIDVSTDYTEVSATDAKVGTYSATSSTSSSASLEVGTYGMKENSRVIVSISTNGLGYSLVVVEELLGSSSKVKTGCYYQVQLAK